MYNDHPMQPSDDQICGWRLQALDARDGGATRENWIARTAYAAGADAQLEAIVHWLITGPYGATIATELGSLVAYLRDAMRPKPPSLTEQAQRELALLRLNEKQRGNKCETAALTAALERLAELESKHND